tara:strand:- start:11111 stop:11701 length:591 start_codon:yes stop_codon:yes gene_type:complete
MAMHFFFRIFLLIPCFLFVSCSSSDDGTGTDADGNDNPDGYYFRVNMDNEPLTYEYDVSGANLSGNFNNTTNDGTYVVSIACTQNIRESGKNNMVFSLASDVPFVAGTTYSNAASPTTVEPDLFVVAYLDGQGRLYNTYNENVLLLTFPDAMANSWIRFTEVTDIYMEGAFSGSIYNAENGTISLTEGEFKLKRFK